MTYQPTHRRKPAGRHRAHPVRRVGLRAPAVVAVVGVGVGLSTGVAAAFWTAGGSGAGSAAAGSAIPLTTVAATASSSSLLYPNGPAADLTLTVQNPNTYGVSVTGVTGAGAVTASGGIGTCDATGVTLTAPAAGLPFTVPAKGSATVVLTAAAQMSTDSDTGCQAATFTVPVALTGTGG